MFHSSIQSYYFFSSFEEGEERGLRKRRMSCVMDWKWMKMIGRMAVKMAMRRGCGELGRMSCVMDW